MRSQRFAWALSLLLAIPIVIGLAAFFVLHEPPSAIYNRCLTSLSPGDRLNPGIDGLITDLKQTDDYKTVTFNVNKPYQKGAVNLLIPSAPKVWPAACPVVEEPADCLASPRDGYIICNPGIGKKVGSPLLNSGNANVETFFAERFLLLTFLGHELGHLRSASHNAQHLMPSTANAAMNCWKPGPSEDTDEQRADAYGSRIACEAIRKRPELELLPTEASKLLKLQSSLEGALDWEYFQMDDACVGDKNYPSVSRRKHTFSKTYLACLYPGHQFNPVADLAEKDASTFDDLERRLRERQVFGIVSSGEFGKAPLYSERTVSDRRGGFLTFDSSGTESSLWHAFRVNDAWKLSSVAKWPATGNLIATATKNEGVKVWLSLNVKTPDSGRKLMRIQVDCVKPDCTVTNSAQVGAPEDLRLALGDARGALYLSGFEAFFISNQESLLASLQIKARLTRIGSPDKFVSAAGSDRGVLVPTDQGGILQTIVLTETSIFQRQMLVTSDPVDHVEAMALSNEKWMFLLAHRPALGDASVSLWACPIALLENSSTATTAECIVRAAPFAQDQSPALANRDLASLFDRRIDLQSCPGLVAVQTQGWLWLIDQAHQRRDLLPASGVIACGDEYVDTFRTRRIDRQAIHYSSGPSTTQTVISIPVN
jgi:hypothetical protein